MRTTDRPYRRITPQVIARHQAEALAQGNGSRAVEVLESDIADKGSRAYRIAKKSQELSPVEYIQDKMGQIGIRAIEKLEELVNSDDERVSQKSTHFAIEHTIGKAVQRTQNTNLNLNIETLLD